MSSFTEAQKSALSKHVDIYQADPDVRNWEWINRWKLIFDQSKVSLCIQWYSGDRFKIEKHICKVPKNVLIAVSPTFADHCSRDPGLITLTFDIGNMDEISREHHGMAIRQLGVWLDDLCATGGENLQAPTFYSNVALWHVARQLGMGMYLPMDATELVQEAKNNILQPWQITEMLFISSIERNATRPVIPHDDPLLCYLANQLVDLRPHLCASEKDDVENWLWKDENAPLRAATYRLMRKKGILSSERED
jgi:hypothetical protein